MSAGSDPPVTLVLLGTKGGPSLSLGRHGPAQLVVVGDRVFLVDCGEGVAHQMLSAGYPVHGLDSVLITHHHSDHNGSYGNVLLSGWAGGLAHRVRSYGPPPLRAITDAFFRMHAYDIDIRIADEGRVDLRDLVEVTELTGGGIVVEDAELRITAAVVDHPPVEPALAYRFDAGGRSVVISGDTAPCERLVDLARGADVLVHEVISVDLLEERIRPRIGNAAWPEFRNHLVRSHTSVDEVGKIAAAAGVRTLVLSHFVPGDLDIPDGDWLEPVRRSFDGEVVLGTDLLRIPV